MSFRGGRDRQWKDYPLRPEEKSRHGRSTAAPPSRHLWVGNLSHTLTERALSNHFRQFGELESVGFSPGRSYAFINFIEESAAFAAFGALQGFILAGNALRIEFTKAEEDDYLRRPRSPFPHRDSGIRHSDSDPIRSTTKDDEEPNEVLWVGFPQSLKVDEQIFRDAFSQFGEINNISTYPGRTYAFIRYKHVNSAIRAKETLQGKLFNNPRVHITFARSESRALNTAKNELPLSPRYSRFHDERKRKSPEGRNLNHGFRDMNDGYDDGYGRLRRSPTRDRNVIFHDFQQPRRFDEWDLPEDGLVYKKMKGGAVPIPVPAELELPEYPFSDSEHVMRPPGFDGNNNGMGHFGFHNNQMIPDSHLNVVQNYGERGNVRNMQNMRNAQNAPDVGYGGFHGGPGSLAQNVVEWKRPTPEPQIPASDEWKWEGIVAKGGTAICRARCFPVGKVLDMILPEFLDCTARTSLDMLSKHYYQAATSYVVFFVPESDADMAFYNEFMNYLGEKQRAAVAKLDDKTTLFLVPPSDFSEKILKVPGKLSISGVILRLEQPPPTATPPPPPHHRHPESSRTSYVSPSGLGPGPFQVQVQPGHQGFPNAGKPRPGLTALYNGDNMQDQHLVNRQNQEMNLSNYHGQQEVKSGGNFGIQQDQLAQPANFLGQGSSANAMVSDNGYRMPHQQMGSGHLASQYHQVPSQQMSQYNQGQSSGQGNGHGQEEEADPQKRLQATLELAATLLKQIQQGKT